MSRKAASRPLAAPAVLLAALALAPAAPAAPQAAAAPAAASPAPTARPRPAGWWRQARIVAELKLTPAQQDALEGVEKAHRETRAAAMRAYSQAYAALVVALAAEPVDEAALATRRAAFSTAWATLGALNADHLVALRGVLSAQQIERLPQVAPAALRAGPLTTRGFGEVGALPPPAR